MSQCPHTYGIEHTHVCITLEHITFTFSNFNHSYLLHTRCLHLFNSMFYIIERDLATHTQTHTLTHTDGLGSSTYLGFALISIECGQSKTLSLTSIKTHFMFSSRVSMTSDLKTCVFLCSLAFCYFIFLHFYLERQVLIM